MRLKLYSPILKTYSPKKQIDTKKIHSNRKSKKSIPGRKKHTRQQASKWNAKQEAYTWYDI